MVGVVEYFSSEQERSDLNAEMDVPWTSSSFSKLSNA